jgi:hypothetical protein
MNVQGKVQLLCVDRSLNQHNTGTWAGLGGGGGVSCAWSHRGSVFRKNTYTCVLLHQRFVVKNLYSALFRCVQGSAGIEYRPVDTSTLYVVRSKMVGTQNNLLCPRTPFETRGTSCVDVLLGLDAVWTG